MYRLPFLGEIADSRSGAGKYKMNLELSLLESRQILLDWWGLAKRSSCKGLVLSKSGIC